MQFIHRLERFIGYLVILAAPLAGIVIAGLWIFAETERLTASALTLLIIVAAMFIWWRVTKKLPSREADKPSD